MHHRCRTASPYAIKHADHAERRFMTHSSLVAITGTIILMSCPSSKPLQLMWIRKLVDFIDVCSIFKWVAQTWLYWRVPGPLPQQCLPVWAECSVILVVYWVNHLVRHIQCIINSACYKHTSNPSRQCDAYKCLTIKPSLVQIMPNACFRQAFIWANACL